MRRFANAFFLLTAAALAAQNVPTAINYQGRLTDNTPQQNPVNATVPMKFAIWNDPAAGTNLWQEPASGGTNVLVVNGIFNVALGGNGVAIPPTLFTGANSTRYLEITVNPGPSQEILAPRQLITATGYANLAQSANTAVSATTAGSATNAANLGGQPAANYLLTTGTAANSSQLGGVADIGWQKKLTTPACPGSQFLATLNQDGTAVCVAPPPAPATANYAFAYDTTTQSAFVANVFMDITFNTNAQFDGWTHTPGTAIFTCNATGLYRIHYTALMQKSGGANTTSTLRLTVNSVEVAGSATGASIVTSTPVPISHEVIVPLNAGDTLRAQYAGGTTSVQIAPAPGFIAVTNPSSALVIERIK